MSGAASNKIDYFGRRAEQDAAQKEAVVAKQMRQNPHVRNKAAEEKENNRISVYLSDSLYLQLSQLVCESKINGVSETNSICKVVRIALESFFQSREEIPNVDDQGV